MVMCGEKCGEKFTCVFTQGVMSVAYFHKYD